MVRSVSACSIRFENDVVITNSAIDQAVDNCLKAIKNELPEKAHSYEIYDFIIDACKQSLKSKQIVL